MNKKNTVFIPAEKSATEKKLDFPILIGLSGQSCAGKNEAALILQSCGMFCIDSDAISREIFLKNEQALLSIFQNEAEKRGFCIRYENGTINKKNFALFIFSDAKLLKKHEDFILPKIEEAINRKIKAAFAENPLRPIVLNAPTLHKTSLLKKCVFIFYIIAPILLRIWRAKKRDKLPIKNILARFSKQKDFFSQYFFLNADTIIVKNFGSLAKLKKTLLQELKKRGF